MVNEIVGRDTQTNAGEQSRRIQHDLIQGSPEWHTFRLEHDGASEAAVMLGISKKATRTELLNAKKTGVGKEFSDWVQEHVLDYGHEVEARARPIVEQIIGETLYPVTYSYGRLSASCDGLTDDNRIAMEHKQWSEELAAAVRRGELPNEHQPQCQQVIDVTGAEKLIFVVSDGTLEKMVWMWVYPDPQWVERINAGWALFHEDLAKHEFVEAIPAAVARPTLDLPAVSIEASGALSIRHNLRAFGEKLNSFIAALPARPETDQEFADCKAALGKLKTAEEALDSEESRALSQLSDIEDMRREKKLLFDLSRTTRLALEKLVTAREAAIKVEVMQEGKEALAEHIAALNARIGKPYMPAIAADWSAAIKNKRNVSSTREAVQNLLVAKKLESSSIADAIQINLNSLRELAGAHAFLFADTASLVLKANDDLTAVIKSRIAEHEAAEAKRLEDERAKIRAEEEARATAKAKADQDRIAAEERAKAESERIEAEVVRQAAERAPGQSEEQRADDAAAAKTIAPIIQAEITARRAEHAEPAADAPTMRLGDIQLRLGIMVSSEFLATLGFNARIERAARLYRADDFPTICVAIANHCIAVSNAAIKEAA